MTCNKHIFIKLDHNRTFLTYIIPILNSFFHHFSYKLQINDYISKILIITLIISILTILLFYSNYFIIYNMHIFIQLITILWLILSTHYAKPTFVSNILQHFRSHSYASKMEPSITPITTYTSVNESTYVLFIFTQSMTHWAVIP